MLDAWLGHRNQGAGVRCIKEDSSKQWNCRSSKVEPNPATDSAFHVIIHFIRIPEVSRNLAFFPCRHRYQDSQDQCFVSKIVLEGTQESRCSLSRCERNPSFYVHFHNLENVQIQKSKSGARGKAVQGENGWMTKVLCIAPGTSFQTSKRKSTPPLLYGTFAAHLSARWVWVWVGGDLLQRGPTGFVETLRHPPWRLASKQDLTNAETHR